MAKHIAKCRGKVCEYHREYCFVKPVGSNGYTPDLVAAAQGLTDRRCTHPKVFTPSNEPFGNNGTSVFTLKACPITNEFESIDF